MYAVFFFLRPLCVGREQRKTEDDPKFYFFLFLFRFFFHVKRQEGSSLKRATDGWTMDIQRVSKISSSSSSFFHSHTLVQEE